MSGIIMGAVTGVGGGGGGGGTITVTVFPDNAIGYTFGAGTGDTPNVTATASGGTGPYTYVWGYYSGPNSDFIISNPSSATTHFTNTVGLNRQKYANYRVTATDLYGNTGFAIIPVGIQDITFSGGVTL